MKIIYKYPLELNVCTIELPKNSKVICVHEQNLIPTLWIEHDMYEEKKDFMFAVVATGQYPPEDGKHIGTCFIGPNVWHVYQKNHD